MKIFGFEVNYTGRGTRICKTDSVELLKKKKPPKPSDEGFYGKLPSGGTIYKLTDKKPPLPPPAQPKGGTRITYTNRPLPKPSP